MLQDLNYGTNIEPIQPVLKRMQAQIDYLDKAKANCVNMQSCNCDGYITFSMDYDGNETIKGKHNLATPICGFNTVEDSLTCLLTSGGGGLATLVRTEDLTEINDYNIPVIIGNSGNYNCVKTVPGLTAHIEYNGMDIGRTLVNTDVFSAKESVFTDCIIPYTAFGEITLGANTCIDGSLSNNCFTIDSNGNACLASVWSDDINGVTNVSSSTNIIQFKDLNGCPLGCISGCSINFVDGSFTNVNTSSFSAHTVGNDCGYLGEVSGFVGLFACGTNNIKLVTGDACVFELSCNKMHYSNVINIQEYGSPYTDVSAVAIGKDACNYTYGCALVVYARGKTGTMGSTHTIHWEAGTKQCDVYKAIYSAIGPHEDNATWSVYGKTEFLEPLGRKMAPMFVSSGTNCFAFSGFPYWNGSADITYPFLSVNSSCEDGVLAGGTISIIAW